MGYLIGVSQCHLKVEERHRQSLVIDGAQRRKQRKRCQFISRIDILKYDDPVATLEGKGREGNVVYWKAPICSYTEQCYVPIL